MTRKPLALWILSAALLVPAVALAAEPAKPMPLPKPRTEGGMPLLTALKQRASSRDFRPDPLPAQLLSDLLWAAAGVNRPDGRRIAPSPHNRQVVDVYVVQADGAFLFDPKAHALVPVASGDLRKLTGSQPFVTTAPLNLVYVLDGAKQKDLNPESVALWRRRGRLHLPERLPVRCVRGVGHGGPRHDPTTGPGRGPWATARAEDRGRPDHRVSPAVEERRFVRRGPPLVAVAGAGLSGAFPAGEGVDHLLAVGAPRPRRR